MLTKADVIVYRHTIFSQRPAVGGLGTGSKKYTAKVRLRSNLSKQEFLPVRLLESANNSQTFEGHYEPMRCGDAANIKESL